MLRKESAVKSKSQTKNDDFVSVAKRLECDEDKAAFESKLGKIAKAPPKKQRARQIGEPSTV
jgi:hypothetical protein